jgi:hypothetical protein
LYGDAGLRRTASDERSQELDWRKSSLLSSSHTSDDIDPEWGRCHRLDIN